MKRNVFSVQFYVRRTKVNRSGESPIMVSLNVNGETIVYPLSGIERLASDKSHDNYSAILIRVCDDEPEDKADSYLFKLRRQLKDCTIGWEYIEFFRTRREAMHRLVELNCYGDKNDIYRYGISRSPDWNGPKWEKHEQKQ